MVKLSTLYFSFLRIGGFTFGGGYAMLPMLEREVVEKYKWVTDTDLVDYYALGQCTPGIIAVNVATLIGYKQRGWLGGIIATLGVITPSIAIILVLASMLNAFADIAIVQHAFAGLRVGVGALILNSVIKLFKKNIKDTRSIVLFICAFICVAIVKISPIIVVFAAVVIGLVIHRRAK